MFKAILDFLLLYDRSRPWWVYMPPYIVGNLENEQLWIKACQQVSTDVACVPNEYRHIHIKKDYYGDYNIYGLPGTEYGLDCVLFKTSCGSIVRYAYFNKGTMIKVLAVPKPIANNTFFGKLRYLYILRLG